MTHLDDSVSLATDVDPERLRVPFYLQLDPSETFGRREDAQSELDFIALARPLT